MRTRFTVSAAFSLLVCPLTWPAAAALTSGVYQTIPGATVEESGDRVPNGSRVVPFAATITLDVEAVPPSLTAELPNAVLEGGAPFMLTVRSSSGGMQLNGTYRFMGDYLADLYPSGTQYGFDWRFSTNAEGNVVWDGQTGWWGGHAWYVTISNIVIVPRPKLEIAQAGSQVTVSWPAQDTGYSLEQAKRFSAPDWSAVTNDVAITGNRFSVKLDATAPQGFFRLRKL